MARKSPLWQFFRDGMSVADMVKASGLSTGRAHTFLRDASRSELTRRKVGGVYRYFERPTTPPDPTAVVSPTLRPLRRAFTGRPPIPVRSSGRVMPIDLQRNFV